MPKMIALIKRNPAMSIEQFRDYYEKKHVPLAEEVVGQFFAKYCRNYPSDSSMLETGSEIVDGFDCITEIWFDGVDMDRMNAMFSEQPDTARRMAEDEAKFMDRSRTHILFCSEKYGF